MLPPEIKVHVNILVKDTATYADVKVTVTEYEVAERRYMPLKEASVHDHTADKCYQRYKEGDAKGKVNQVTAPETGATVTVVRQQEADTSPETELRVTSTGVRSCTEDGRAMVLIDSGSDEHLCPEDFAPWCRTTTRRNGPALRDAQGSVISHESRLKFYGADRMTAEIEIPFLIGPVKQLCHLARWLMVAQDLMHN